METPTQIGEVCTGDCDSSGEVTISELVLGVNIALEIQPLSVCSAMDRSEDGAVQIDELITAVLNALSECPGPPALVSVRGSDTSSARRALRRKGVPS